MKLLLSLRQHKNFGAFALLFVCFTLCLPGASGQTFPGTGTRSVLGSQTTALGLTFYGNAAPNVTPSASNWRTTVRFHVDTAAQVQWAFLGSTWKTQGVIRRVTPPPATATNGSATLDYRYAKWQADGDSTRYAYDFREGCWSPIGVYQNDTIPTDVAAGVGTGAVCYEFAPWLNTTNDSLYLFQSGAWIKVGSGSGTGSGIDTFYRSGDSLYIVAGVDTFSAWVSGTGGNIIDLAVDSTDVYSLSSGRLLDAIVWEGDGPLLVGTTSGAGDIITHTGITGGAVFRIDFYRSAVSNIYFTGDGTAKLYLPDAITLPVSSTETYALSAGTLLDVIVWDDPGSLSVGTTSGDDDIISHSGSTGGAVFRIDLYRAGMDDIFITGDGTAKIYLR